MLANVFKGVLVPCLAWVACVLSVLLLGSSAQRWGGAHQLYRTLVWLIVPCLDPLMLPRASLMVISRKALRRMSFLRLLNRASKDPTVHGWPHSEGGQDASSWASARSAALQGRPTWCDHLRALSSRGEDFLFVMVQSTEKLHRLGGET